MKFKTTIILAVIAIIGAAYVFLYEKKQETVKDKYIQQKKIFPGLSGDAVFKIEMIKNGEKFLFKRRKMDSYGRGGQWIMEEPIKTRADKAVISGFLSELEFLERVSHFQEVDAKGAGKEDYGLDNPTFDITVWTGKNWASQKDLQGSESIDNSVRPGEITEYRLLIGDRVSTGKHVYAQLKDSDEILVINDAVAMKLDFNPNGFRDKWVLDIDESIISGMKIYRGVDDIIDCSRKEDQWWMTKPVLDRCENKKIAEIITSLKNLKIEEDDFITDADTNLATYGLANPKVSVVLEQNDDIQGVSFGFVLDNKIYAKRNGENSIFLINDIIVNELGVDPNILRSRELVRFETVASTLGVERVEIKSQKTNISIIKTKEYDWKIIEPIEVLADMDVVKELIEEIKDLRIQEFVTNKSDDLAKYGLKDPKFTVEIYKKGKDKPTKMFFGNVNEKGNLCYVKRPEEDPVFAITSKGIYEKLVGGLLTFQDKLVLEFDKELVEEIVMNKGGITFDIVKNSGRESNWKLKEPIVGLPDDKLVDQMVQAISFLKTTKFVAGANVDLSGFGLDNPALRVKISYKEAVRNEDGHGNTLETPQENETEKSNSDQLADQKEPNEASAGTLKSSTLIIGNKVSQKDGANYFAMVDGNDKVFEIDEKVVNLCNSEIVSKSIQKFNATKAKRLVLSSHGKEFEFARPEGTWKLMKSGLVDISSRQIEFIIWLLSDITADQIIEYNLNNVIKYGLDNPDIKAAVYLFDDSLFEVLAVNSNKNDSYFVMSRNSNCIYTVNKELIERLIEHVNNN